MGDQPKSNEAVLRGASDGLLLAIHEVEARERRKRGLQPADQVFLTAAHDVRIAAETVLTMAIAEEEAAKRSVAGSADETSPTIERTVPSGDLASILAEWREVERQLAASDVGSADEQTLMRRFEALRDRYAAALELRRQRE